MRSWIIAAVSACTLEPFIQLNHNAYLHSANAFDGKPQRIRDIKADFDGGVAELLAKATKKGRARRRGVDGGSGDPARGAAVAGRARQGLPLPGRRRIQPSHRGYAKHPGGGLGAEPVAGEPIGLHDILKSRLWRGLQSFLLYDFQTTMFQPVGGMGRIGEAFARQIPDRIRYGAKVIAIQQNDSGVTVAFEDASSGGVGSGGRGRLVRLHPPAQHPEPDPDQRVRADEGGDRRRSLCVRGEVRAAVQAPVLGGGRAHLRRHQLHRSADPPDLLSEHEFQRRRARACCSAATRSTARTPTSSRRMPPAERVKRAVEFGAQIHPQYRDRVRERRLGRLAPCPVHPWLRGRLVGRSAKGALQRPLPDRRPHRAGRRARLLHSGLAGGRDPVGAGRDPAACTSASSHHEGVAAGHLRFLFRRSLAPRQLQPMRLRRKAAP